MTWTYLMEQKALPEGKTAHAYPLGVNVVIANVAGAFHAISGKCAHLACPLITGTLEGHTLTCSCHDWRFDLRTGRFLEAPELGVAVYPVKAEGGQLFVALADGRRE